MIEKVLIVGKGGREHALGWKMVLILGACIIEQILAGEMLRD